MGNSNPKPDRAQENLVLGRNAVVELLRGTRQVECVYICEEPSAHSQPIARIVAMAKEQKIPVKRVDVKKLDSLSGGLNHQGVAALAAAFPYASIEDIFQRAGGRPLFILIADSIEDPHNLGAMIRTAEAAGAHGLIIPKRGGVGLTPIVGRTSAGAVEHLPVVRVTNLVATIKQLKERGVWVYGADMDGQRWEQADLTGNIALVIGSEGGGLSRLVRENCDVILSLPMCGKVNSLNASVAAGILIYEAVRQRTKCEKE
ncbi:MAG: 23S rRNA (guanosine(2251)-2'-O)-methyltransferase RlmB [Anaerotruncus sp.]|nr:23S rRNA (guanosine(2251)-2'-O)-methyltransferase RlmB [Anaerotruncus sp.]